MRKRNVYFGSFGILLLFIFILKFFVRSALPPDTSPQDATARRHLAVVIPDILNQSGWDSDRLWVMGSDRLRAKWPPEKLKPHFDGLRSKYGILKELKIVSGDIVLRDKGKSTLRGDYILECRFARGSAYLRVSLTPGSRHWAIDDFTVDEISHSTPAKL